MIYRTFGRTGWRLGQIGVGGCQFGGPIQLDGHPDGWTGITDAESQAIIRRAVELDANFFDTADMYGWGHSEEILGSTLKAMGARDRVYLATKVGFWHDDAGRRTFNESYDYVIRACEDSLRRLQTDYLDLYQCHLWRTEQWAEFLDAFETLQTQGKIRFFGVSTNDFDMVQRFDERKKLASVQADYNLLDRRAEKEILPYCRSRGIAFIARKPLAMGKLGGEMIKSTRFDADDLRSQWLEPEQREAFQRDLDAVERLKPVAREASVLLAQLALKFVLTHVAVSVAIPGAKTPAQLERNIAVNVLPALTQVDLAAIERALSGGAG